MGRTSEPEKWECPRGVRLREMRTGTRIQIAFTYQGKECRELLDLPKVNKGTIAYAASLLGEIKRKIEDDAFRYEAYFPNSPMARKFQPPAKWVLMKDLLQQQLATYERQVANSTISPSTLRGYAQAINGQLLPQWGAIALADVTPAMLRGWIASLDVTGKRVRNLMTPLRAVFEDAVNDELIDVNPLDKIALSRLIRQTARKSDYTVDPFDVLEVGKLLDACRADERPMLSFWLETGLRTGEMIALAWPSVDLERRLVKVCANTVTGLVDGKAVPITKAPKTAAGIREVELTDAAVSALTVQRLLYPNAEQVWLNPRAAEPWSNESQIRKTLWVPLCKRSGVDYRNPYQLRHTFASTRLTAGCNPFWLADQMGHVDVEMVFKVYGRWISENYRQGKSFAPDSHR